MHEFNYWFYKSFAQLKSFPGGTSKEPTLKGKRFNTTLLYIGVDDPLKDKSQDSKKIGLKCKLARAARILISGIVVNNSYFNVTKLNKVINK